MKVLDFLSKVIFSDEKTIASTTHGPLLQQHEDNSPIDTAGIVRRWLDEQPHIRLLAWPSKGRDLIPNENV
ncbi:hypothetical protein Hamer_G019007 [Homarus americanus]|uniref:Uncharacterized protein n=1 Tax=Homarus americanus TaxID=6706 RepID=A0A8J5MXJ7_HOMAM|nr:hypothetical protein Hamer_G019007 [Homarus americanus]